MEKLSFSRNRWLLLLLCSVLLPISALTQEETDGLTQIYNSLKNQLAGYKQLNQQFADRIKELEARLARLADTSETAYQQHQQLADGIRQAGIDVAIVAERVDSAITHADAVEHVTDELQHESEGLGNIIAQLGEFLEEYGAKTEIH